MNNKSLVLRIPPFGLSALLFSLVILVLLTDVDFGSYNKAVMWCLFAFVMSSSIYLISNLKFPTLLSILIALFILVLVAVDVIFSYRLQTLLIFSLLALFFIIIVGELIHLLLHEQQITRNLVLVGLAIYFLIGLIWTSLYVVLETIQSGSFILISTYKNNQDSARILFGQLSYFSYVTLSTLGYGDITPATRLAQNLSSLEAITGQFYLAVVIARLVSLSMKATSQAGENTSKQ